MNIKEYAEEMGFTVQEVLKKCKELGINITDPNEYLNDDDFVTLDLSMNLISTDNETNFDEETIFRAAYTYEQNTSFRNDHKPTFKGGNK